MYSNPRSSFILAKPSGNFFSVLTSFKASAKVRIALAVDTSILPKFVAVNTSEKPSSCKISIY